MSLSSNKTFRKKTREGAERVIVFKKEKNRSLRKGRICTSVPVFKERQLGMHWEGGVFMCSRR